VAPRAAELYPAISPVNSFRVVFNAYFGTALPMLPDRVFAHQSESRPYAFAELTETLRPPRQASGEPPAAGVDQ
jgi:hypothetical protein